MKTLRSKLIGDRRFYRMVLTIAVPIMIQNGITNFVNMLDNIMVGQIGTGQMSGVAIVNQLIFVFNLCIFGGISGAGIFGAQFYGSGDHKGVRDSFRFKLVICGLILVISILLFMFKGDYLIELYLYGDQTETARSMLDSAWNYLRIMLIGLIPFTIEQVYASTLRECGETILPMKAGICAVLVNLIFNYLLIFGKFGFPELGVAGAAIATVMARFVEMSVVVIWTHVHHQKNKFIVGAYRHFSIPIMLTKDIIIKGTPLMMNEILWSSAQAVLIQCYAVRGLAVIGAFNISLTIANVFNIAFIAMGSAVSIIVGQRLGAGEMEEAKDTAWKLIAFSVFCCIIMGALMFICSPLFPKIYNTTDEIRTLATRFMWVASAVMPIHGFLNSTYFTLRSGGKTFITFIFDCVFAWVVSIPAAYLLTRYTGLIIIVIYLIVQMLELLKCGLGYYLLKKGYWIQNIVGKGREKA